MIQDFKQFGSFVLFKGANPLLAAQNKHAE